MNIPWAEKATVTSDGDGEGRILIVEGSLEDVVTHLSKHRLLDVGSYMIAMPDRGAPPYRFEGVSISDLIASLSLRRRTSE